MLALDKDGLVWGYGDTAFGQLGIRPPSITGKRYYKDFVQIPNLPPLQAISSTGLYQNLGLDKVGKVWIWGDPIPTGNPNASPLSQVSCSLELPQKVKSIASGFMIRVALAENNDLYVLDSPNDMYPKTITVPKALTKIVVPFLNYPSYILGLTAKATLRYIPLSKNTPYIEKLSNIEDLIVYNLDYKPYLLNDASFAKFIFSNPTNPLPPLDFVNRVFKKFLTSQIVL